MNDGHNLQIPGQVKVGFRFNPGANAEPIHVTMTNGGQANVMIMGGFTKLEHGALLVAAGAVAEGVDAAGVVSFAESVLNECAERQKPGGDSED